MGGVGGMVSHRKSRPSKLSNSALSQFKLSEANMAQQYK